MLSTMLGSEGTNGILGGRAGEEGYGWWVNLEFFILFQNALTGLLGVLTSG